MDCFYAAIEMRDNPALKNKPVAVGGTTKERGVLATCNYEARKYGLHSAMSTVRALQLCPKLVLLPVNMHKYKAASKVIYRIFRQYTPLVEMLSLDEGFLDVTNCHLCKNSATLIAKTIKERIKKELKLTASAGVAANKFLAKIASEWQKPDGLFVITPDEVDSFIPKLPVTKIFGVGKVTAQKLHALKIFTCADLQETPLDELTEKFGKMGPRFYELCRGIDEREIEPERVPKSLSVEETFPKDLPTLEMCLENLTPLIHDFHRRLQRTENLEIAKQFVKIKFFDFKRTTVETVVKEFADENFYQLLRTGFSRCNKPVRLIGVGIRFK